MKLLFEIENVSSVITELLRYRIIASFGLEETLKII